eukprot:m.37292 g.37292  ORF g.37292 m.37292 type:complete len:287 (-) comp17622_c0_seq1:307-1167(-)
MSLTPTGTPNREVMFGDIPTHFSTDELSSERLICQLEEFDIEVESRIDGMKADVSRLTNSLRQKFAIELIKLPKRIRSMSLRTFREKYGGDIGAVQKEEVVQKMSEVADLPPPPSTARRSKRNHKATEPTTAVKRAKTTTEPQTASKRQSSRKVAASARKNVLQDRNMQENFKTPMMKKRGKNTEAATPAIDPRLLATPFLRMPKRGESFMSMNGSPIAVENNVKIDSRSSIITMTLGNSGNKMVQLDETTLATVKKTLSKRAKKEANDKLQQLMDQIKSCMEVLA